MRNTLVLSIAVFFISIVSSNPLEATQQDLKGSVLISIKSPSEIYEYNYSTKQKQIHIIEKSVDSDQAFGKNFGSKWALRVKENDERVYKTKTMLDSLASTQGLTPSSIVDWYVDPNMKYALRSESYEYLHIVDLESLTIKILTGNDKSFGMACDWSPDGNFLAVSTTNAPFSEKPRGNISIITLTDMSVNNKYEFTREISSIVWSPDSKFVALLTRTTSRGSGFWDFLSSLFGKPIDYHTFYLEIYTLEGEEITEVLVHENLPRAMGRMLWLE